MKIESKLNQLWYENAFWFLQICLRPFAYLFSCTIKIRKFFLEQFIVYEKPNDLPIIVIGNINVGGTGKTPVVIETASYLSSIGYSPCVIIRGYRRKGSGNLIVTDSTSVDRAGDEACLIHAKAKVPVVVGSNRKNSLSLVESKLPECNVIISDDGLQHYAMPRDFEVAVSDEARGFGNQWLLPAGPLREPLTRLDSVNFHLKKSTSSDQNSRFIIRITHFKNLKTGVTKEFFNHEICHAVAGIGDPNGFFDALEAKRIAIKRHFFPDHHAYRSEDFELLQDAPVIMTEKDAIKCSLFLYENLWVAETQAILPQYYLNEIKAFLSSYQKRCVKNTR